jgi:hypothetical protein
MAEQSQTIPQNQAAQSQGTPQQQPSPNPASVSTDSLVCQWQNCGERCPSAEQLYVSPVHQRDGEVHAAALVCPSSPRCRDIRVDFFT